MNSFSYPRLMRQQRGAAIVVAMIMVALVASIASAALVWQWQLTQVEAAWRQRQQAWWLLDGALQWSRLILRQDAQADAASAPARDHLAEPWAVALRPTRLDAFIASAQASAGLGFDASELGAASSDVAGSTMSGQMHDLSARLNLLNFLFLPPQDAQRARAQVQALFVAVGRTDAEATALLRALQAGADPRDAQRPLMPQRVGDLLWLGVDAKALQAIAPYVSLIPAHVSVNLNTAPRVVLQALSNTRSASAADRIVAQRRSEPFASVSAAIEAAGGAHSGLNAADLSVRSDHFVASGTVHIPHGTSRTGLGMQAWLHRQAQDVRQRATVTMPAP